MNSTDRVALFGIGLMGGSLACALKEAQPDCHIYGFDRNAVLEHALDQNMIDEKGSYAQLEQCAWIILAVPMRAMPGLLSHLSVHAHKHNIMIDIGSVKGYAIKSAQDALDKDQLRHFVACHPMTGKENNGINFADAKLFSGCKVLITPSAQTDAQALDRVLNFWSFLGAEPVFLEHERHDRIVAFNSHLPHLLSYGLVHLLKDLSKHEDLLFELGGGGLKDFVRIASSSPTMWLDISLTNRRFILDALDAMKDKMGHMYDLIENNDVEGLRTFLAQAQQFKLNQS